MQAARQWFEYAFVDAGLPQSASSSAQIALEWFDKLHHSYQWQQWQSHTALE
jgi:hypothetical protein